MKSEHKHLLTFLILILISAWGSLKSQITIGDDGLYYDETGKLYTGIYVEKYPTGTKKTEMSLVNGRKEGLTQIYYSNGVVNELRMYKNNLMHGTWVTWNEKGINTAEANYANDIKNGKWYIWDEQGIMRYDMTYFNGRKAGAWRMFDEHGILTATKEFDLNPELKEGK